MDAEVAERDTDDFRTIASEKDCLGYLGSGDRWLNCPKEGKGKGDLLDFIRLRIRSRTNMKRAIKAAPPTAPPIMAPNGVLDDVLAADGTAAGLEGWGSSIGVSVPLPGMTMSPFSIKKKSSAKGAGLPPLPSYVTLRL